jgi:hypothetical protein
LVLPGWFHQVAAVTGVLEKRNIVHRKTFNQAHLIDEKISSSYRPLSEFLGDQIARSGMSCPADQATAALSVEPRRGFWEVGIESTLFVRSTVQFAEMCQKNEESP